VKNPLENEYLHPPEKNPYRIANTTTVPAVDIPNKVNTMTPVPKLTKARTFNTPNLSAKKFGMVRPKTDAPF